MPLIQNFLQQGISHIRQSIIDIDDSYNNDWDILAELIQNSVDAIRKLNINNGEINIKIDSLNRSISVSDNGIGITPSELPKLLCMFGTNKKTDEKTIGEKGVGLKFAMFSCNDFYIKSGNENGTSEATVIDALNWKASIEEKPLDLIHDLSDETFQGTEVVLKNIPEIQILSLSQNQIKFVLRTRTAIGNTNTIWSNDDLDILVNLIYKDQNGIETAERVPFKYWLPIENLDNNEKISVHDYQEYIKEDRTDSQKRLKLKNKIIYKDVTFDHKGRNIKAFACFVPKRKTWNDLSIAFKIASNEQLENDIWMENYSYTTFQTGIFTSVKGMPTGISIEHPITGASGSWPQIFIIFEDRKLKFDIGRKSIHGKQKIIYKEYARQLFSEFQRFSKYISGDVTPEVSPWDRDEIFKEIEKLIDIKSSETSFIKTPKDQEGTVAGIFFECIGNKKIKDIKPLISGYKNKYDLYAFWGNKRVVIEFKSKLNKILKDFNDEAKLFNEINCVVCWDVNEEDEQVFSYMGISLEKIPPVGILGGNNFNFPNSTHILRYSGIVSPIYVIDMKIILVG